MKVQELPLEDIIPYENNPRVNDHAIDSIVKSIEQFGWQQPLVLDKDRVIIVGHTRFKAAQKMGLKTAPCVIADQLTEEKVKAYRLLDNKTGEISFWNTELLTTELQEIQIGDLDLLEAFKMVTHQVHMADIEGLKDHPKNYKQHPDDQIEHLCQSIKENGIYKNVVIACDGTILAGHGIVKAARKLGLKHVPVLQLSIDPNDTKALKLLTADNEVVNLSETDDRALSGILKDILDNGNLLGTGYDEKMLANLIFVTRPASEIKDHNEAAEWVGMPDYEKSPEPLKITVSFATPEEREQFCGLVNIEVPTSAKSSTWWPPKPREDLASLKIEQGA